MRIPKETLVVQVANVLPLLGVIGANFVLPGFLLYSVWRPRDRTRMGWTLRAISTGTYVGFVFVAGHWSFVGYALRYTLPLAFVLAAWLGSRRVRPRPWFETGVRWKTLGDVAGLAVLIGLFGFSLRGVWHRGEPVQLASPLRDGTYYVSQGGDSLLLNHHHRNRTQRYAIDILELNAFGLRATELNPDELADYVIYDAPVYSPCDGEAIEVVDGLPDQAISEQDVDNAPGNYLVIRCAGVRVLLAHFRPGTVSATVGQRVRTGERIGRVGNSGNSTEPHLHVHATRGDGQSRYGVPMLIHDRFLARNALIVD